MPSDVVFGKKTIIYGANGTGKSSISEFLRSAASDTGAPSGFKSLESTIGSKFKSWDKGNQPDFSDLKVFNHFYVEEKLRGFLEANGQSQTIFKLGNNADAESAERNAAQQVNRFEQRLIAVNAAIADAEKNIKESEKSLKDNVVNTLSIVDNQKYSTYRFDVRAARNLLFAPKLSALSSQDFNSHMSTATMEAPAKLAPLSPCNIGLAKQHSKLLSGLAMTTSAVIIKELAENPEVSKWVSNGLEIHEVGSTCKFCTGTFSAERLKEIQGHFDDSTTEAKDQLAIVIDDCDAELKTLQSWASCLPHSQDFYPDLQIQAGDVIGRIQIWVDSVEKQLSNISESAQLKIDDFYASVSPETLDLTINCPLDELLSLVSTHNNRSTEHSSEVGKSVEAVLGHLSEPFIDGYLDSTKRKPRLAALAQLLRSTIVRYQRAESRYKADQTDATYMAGLIDEDIRVVFGRSDLAIVPSEDRKGYVVRRHGKSAQHLSEGERKMIALSYFVRSLEADDLDRKQVVAVIDDPVSSLDRENMYAAFSWLQEKLKDLSQTIILTHDFELLRLYVTATSNLRKESKRVIGDGNAEESWFPRISFLEVSRCENSTDLEKRIQLKKFPEFILRHDSEYHYLFHKVITTARSDGEDSLLPLVGNASRRLLEGFASFQAPAGTSFQEKIDMSCLNKVNDTLKNRVVKFAHGQSHRENPNPTTGVDLPSVRSEIRALLDLIKGCNDEHFGRMCKATGSNPDW